MSAFQDHPQGPVSLRPHALWPPHRELRGAGVAPEPTMHLPMWPLCGRPPAPRGHHDEVPQTFVSLSLSLTSGSWESVHWAQVQTSAGRRVPEALPTSGLPISAACGQYLRSLPLGSCGLTRHLCHISPGLLDKDTWDCIYSPS